LSRKDLIEDIYPLSPTQQGMLFHTLYAPRSGQYFEQLSCTLRGDFDAAAFQRAWEEVVRRHPVLRTVFVWEKRDEPIQLVYRRVRLRWREEDWRQLPPSAREERFADFLRRDQEEGFDLSRPPLARFALLRLEERAWRFVWSHHHLLLDGWSLPLVLREVFQLYPALRRGELPDLPASPPYRAFIEWLLALDPAASERFWREALAGFSAPTPLGVERPAGGQGFEEIRRELGEEETAALQALARRHRLTLGTVVQGAWAALLSRYSGEDDVVFGLTVSGRPADLPGVESMVGLFINTLPVRAAVPAAARLVPWLRDLQARQAGLQAHSHAPLADVQRWSAVPRGTPLFESIVVIENYPVDAAAAAWSAPDEGLRVEDARTAERTHYPVTLSAAPGERLRLSLSWDASRVDGAAAGRMLDHLAVLLAGMATADPETPVADLPLLTPEERRLIRDWNPPEAEWPGDAPLHALVAGQARRNPGAVAVVHAGERVSRAGLDAAAGRIARALRAAGVGPEDRVGLLLERSPRAVAAVLGTLRAGAAYVPLDPAYGPRRLSLLLEDAAPRALLVDGPVPAGIGPLPPCVLDLADLPEAAEEGGEEVAVDPDGLAYVIYTSGSTGRPKGVMVSHRALANAYRAWEESYRLREDVSVHLQAASFSFDVFTGDLARALASGGRLVICPRDVLLAPAELHALLAGEGADAAELVPAVARQLADHLEEHGGDLSRLRLLAVGSDAWYGADRNRLARLCGPGTRLINSYGVTEATIDSSWYECSGELPGDAPVPIGRPFANSSLHVVDPALRQVPPGVAGELVIGGRGLARGYLGRPGLTAERFVPDPFGGRPGARLYRTGDLARWRPDGNLELLGRADHQVKVRGHRIEPGEVEAVLAEHPDVARCVVVARRDGGSAESRLAAYLVPRGETAVAFSELRRFLAERLPEFMVPAAFVVLDELPLTPNGKIDRQALPAPDLSGRTAATPPTAPGDPLEAELAGIWSEVLRVERLGVHDDFFELGGDSILSIQIVSRAHRAGLRVTPRQIFEHPTVAALAAAVRAGAGEAGVAATAPERTPEPAGPVPLTPIQRWFFEQGLAEPHHWNQALLLAAARPLDPGRLEAAARRLEARHDALRLRFRPHGSGWEQRVEVPGGPGLFTCLDLSGLPLARWREALETAAARLQASLDLDTGPVARFALFRLGGGEPERLLALAHHLVVDGVSWTVLLGDLEEGGQAPPATTPFAAWARGLEALGASGALGAEAPLWLGAPARVPALPLDGPGGPEADTGAGLRTLSAELGEDETRAFLRDASRTLHARADEVLLAALALAFRRWTGAGPLLVDLEGHGREEELVPGADLSRTVGWFTAVVPVWLDAGGGDPAMALGEAKERLRALPRRGIGHGLLRYLGDPRTAARLAGQPRAEVSFNYLGQVDRALPSGGSFLPAAESPGPMLSPRGRRAYRFEINALVTGGRLRVDWSYGGALYRPETVAALAAGFLAGLRELLVDVGEAGDAGAALVPSDFPLAGLDAGTLGRLAAGGPVEDVYPLSPMQEGMLFHSLYAPGSGVYVEHLSFAVAGDFDPAAFRGAWEAALARHAALRSDFVWEGLPEPLQVVRRRVDLPWRELDWRHLDPAGQRLALDELIEGERRRGFDLSRAPLMRLTVARTGAGLHRVVWCHHHLLLDGWSLPVLMADVLAFYEGLRRGGIPRLPAPRPYRDYIAWLRSRDLADEPAFWRGALAGLAGPTALGIDLPAAGGEGAPDLAEHRTWLEEGATAALQDFARRHRLTLNTLLQGAWAVLLGRYSGEEDLVYGSAFSGRPATFPDAETLVGLFINTLPVRARVPAAAPLLPWLREFQDRLIELRQHEHVPLVEIQGWSRWPRGLPLFESLFVFENFPLGESLPAGEGGGAEIRDVVSSEGTNYALTLGAAPGRRLALGFGWDRRRFEPAAVPRLAGHLGVLLRALVEDPERPLGELPVLTGPERAALLIEWNDQRAEIAPPLCAHAAVRRQAAESPDAVAVEMEGETLTYGGLVARAQALAGALRAAGVGPGVPVGLCADRSPAQIVGLLGILEAGGAYLPLDPAYPENRLRYMLEDSGARVLLAGHGRAGLFAGGPARLLPLDGPWEAADMAGPAASPEDLAYVIYTSGSTGRPKGVELRHGGLCNLIRSQIELLDLRPGDRILQFCALSFDAAVADVFQALMSGATLVLAGRESMLPGPELPRLLRAARITTVSLPPSVLALLPREELPELRTLIVAGEACSRDLVDRWAPGRRFLNAYGPTEVTVGASMGRCLPGGPPVIGRPFLNTRIYLLGRGGEPVPVGAPGEIHVACPGLARGYTGRPELTAAAFVPDPFAGLFGEPGGRVYRTGDLARRLPDGALEFIGRVDGQAKLRGFRVEPGEVEDLLRRHPAVREAAVAVREEPGGDRRLVAWVVPARPEAGEEGPALWPSVFEYPVWDDLMYFAMSRDDRRMGAYRAAIERAVPGKVVLEIGTGRDAALSRFCLEAGARRVYALEAADEAYGAARARLEELGLAGRIVLVHGSSLDVELPEPVDVCVSSIVGSIASNEGAVPVLNDARRFLAPGGVMIPGRCVSRIAAVELPAELREAPAFTAAGARYLRRIFEVCGGPFDVRLCVDRLPESSLLSGAGIFEDLDFSGPVALDDRPAELAVTRPGRLDGFVVWLRMHADGEAVVDYLEARQSLLPVFLPVFEPGLEVRPGDLLRLVCSTFGWESPGIPDYRLRGTVVRRDGPPVDFEHDMPTRGGAFRAGPFHRRALAADGSPVRIAGGGEAPRLGAGTLRNHLRASLPEHMVPSAFVTLPELPRLANGKVDRRALPAPGGEEARTVLYAPPRSELEERVAGLWRELLRVERVGLHDNFFDLGGHSLLVVRMQGGLKAMGWDLDVVELFRHPTVASLAARLSEGDAAAGHLDRARGRMDRRRESESQDEQLRRQASRLRRRTEP
jgi:amino acid adenylation domain-containing protein/non-ribosomal peptide synthase protein (TIGR01720 family)